VNELGITLVNVRGLLKRDGTIIVTPPQLRVEAHDLTGVLTAA